MDAIAARQRDGLIGFDPLSPEYLADPYPFLTAAAAAAPAFYCEAIGHWVVTRYHDVRQIFRTPALFSAGNANSPLRPVCPMATKVLDEGGFKSAPTLANADPPAHTRVRKIANVAFTPKRVAEMEPFIRDLTIRFCEERLRDGHADMVRDFAWALPALVLFRFWGFLTTRCLVSRKAPGVASCSFMANRRRRSRYVRPRDSRLFGGSRKA
jgi:cytochrome P450